MKQPSSVSFKDKILTIQYPDLSFTDYYLDGEVWRKMPGMKRVSDTIQAYLTALTRPQRKVDQLLLIQSIKQSEQRKDVPREKLKKQTWVGRVKIFFGLT